MNINLIKLSTNINEKEKYLILSKLRSVIERYYSDKECFERDEHIWQSDIEDEIDGIFYNVIHPVVDKHYHSKDIIINQENVFPKLSYSSIFWEVFNTLCSAVSEELTPTDLQHLKKFLQTPKGKQLEGWAEWEAYWEKREAARAKKKK